MTARDKRPAFRCTTRIKAMAYEFAIENLRQALEHARDLDGSMGERLDAFADASRRLSPATSAIVDRLVSRLKDHEAGAGAPKPGDIMPPFALPDEAGRMVSLKDLLKTGPAVVTFH